MIKLRDTLVLNRDMRPVSMLPPTTINWKIAIKAVFTGAAQIVHEYDDWEVHSPSTTMNVPSVVMVRDYIHFQKEIPWNNSYLMLRDDYKCQYCLKTFGAQHLTEDHVLPRKFGGRTSYDNIVAACAPCNHRRGHNVKIQPKKKPYKPTYWELVIKLKQYELVVPDSNWLQYLDWAEDKIFVSEHQNKILRELQEA